MALDHYTLGDAMLAGDSLTEAKLRYLGLAESWDSMPQLRGQLNSQLSAAKAEWERLEAESELAAQSDAPEGSDEANFGKVVPFDASRYGKTG